MKHKKQLGTMKWLKKVAKLIFFPGLIRIFQKDKEPEIIKNPDGSMEVKL